MKIFLRNFSRVRCLEIGEPFQFETLPKNLKALLFFSKQEGFSELTCQPSNLQTCQLYFTSTIFLDWLKSPA